MTFEFFIPGPLPSMNDIIDEARRNRFAAAKQKKQWTEAVHWAARAAKLPPIECARFHFGWHEKSKRRDPDNISGGGRKLILDGLQSAGVLKNDGWSQVLGFTDSFFVTPEKPGVRVIISPV